MHNRDCTTFNILHDFQTVLKQPDAMVDVCARCKLEKTYKIDSRGRMDNIAYAKDHEKDFLHGTDTRFQHEYKESN